ncbi:spidroin-1 [Pimephales promelas]|nr:spidroin-1 [Pimephales promelas]
MGENEVKTENTEQMQESHASSSDKIDLSLDDIIRLNKKEEKANRAKSKRASNRSNVLKKLNQVPQQQQRGLRQGQQRSWWVERFERFEKTKGIRERNGVERGFTKQSRCRYHVGEDGEGAVEEELFEEAEEEETLLGVNEAEGEETLLGVNEAEGEETLRGLEEAEEEETL